MLSVLLGMCTGIIVSFFTTHGVSFAIICLALACSFGYKTVCSPVQRKVFRRALVACVGAALVCVSIPIYETSYYSKQRFVNTCSGVSCGYRGVIEGKREIRGHDARYVMKLTHIQNVPVQNIYVYAFMPVYPHYTHGDSLSFRGEVVPVRPFLSDTGDTVDYPRILQAQNIHTVLQSSDVIKKESVSSIRSWSVRITSELATVLQTAMSEPASGLGRGIALGERQALSAHDEELFRTTGLSHIVVFSGSNVALIVICLWFLLGMFSTTSRVIVICSSVWCVIAAIGFDPPAVRAGIMATIVLLTQSIGKHAAVLEVFFATVILMLIYNPFQLLFDVSFQLSALAVLSLITLAPLSYEVLSKKVPKVLAFALSLHISVTLLVSPLLLYTFGTFSVVSVLANILVAPLVPLALCMTLATAVLGFTLPSVVPIFAIPTELVLYAIYRIAETLASVPHASMALGSVSLPAVCLWYLGVLCVYLMTRNVRQLQTS